MNVWVKEIPEVLTISMVKKWVKEAVNLKLFSYDVNIDCMDVLIISKQEKNENLPLCNMVIYEEILQEISLNILQEYKNNYDFYYLQHALLEAKQKSIETIITGSSYGRLGVLDQMLYSQNAVNLSLSSQDLYYSIRGGYEVYNINKNIKNIVICCSYYYFFSDLSKSKNSNVIKLISKIYMPLFQDMHNCVLMPRKENILFESEIFDISNIMQCYAMVEYQKGYFNENKTRRTSATKTWREKNKDWLDLTEQEKFEVGKERAEIHNRNIKREASFVENVRLFQQFVMFCNKKHINLTIVAVPISRYYRTYIDENLKKIFYNVLNNCDGEVHLLDLSDDLLFEDIDFNDADHLSDFGAYKMTEIIFGFLKEIEGKYF